MRTVTTSKEVPVKCYSDVTESNAPSVPSSSSNAYYRPYQAVYIGSEKVFVTGFSDSTTFIAAIYDMANDTWTAAATSGSFAPSTQHRKVTSCT